jgi:SNF2 family DNA or RNA helicase
MGKVKLYGHQAEAVRIASESARFGFFWKPGTGKTIAILAICKSRPKRTLIVATKAIVETAWTKDGAAMGVPVVSAMGTKPKRRAILADKSNTVVAINYDQFRIERDAINAAGFDRFVFDESSMLKNRESKTFEAAATCAWANPDSECYLLTGTPAPNSPIEVWSQLYLIDKKAAGGTFWRFANHFFAPLHDFIPARGGGVKKVVRGWVFKSDSAKASFEDHMSKYSWALRKEECIDLPPSVDATIYVDLSRNERHAYEGTRDDAMLSFLKDPKKPVSRDNLTLEGVNTKGISMKLRQIAGGTVHTKTGVQRIGSSKLEALSAWLDEAGPDTPVVIWAEFTAEIDGISKMLSNRGERHDIIDGRTKDSVSSIVQRFQAGETTRIIAHPQSAGHGTDGLQRVCQYAVFYSLSFSSEYHEQARDRLDRSGQKASVTFVYLIAQDTIDESMLDTVTGKMSAQDAFMRELSRGLK